MKKKYITPNTEALPVELPPMMLNNNSATKNFDITQEVYEDDDPNAARKTGGSYMWGDED